MSIYASGWGFTVCGLIMRSYLQLRTFSRIRMKASIPRESKCCNTDGRSVWTAEETMLKTKPLWSNSTISAHPCIMQSIMFSGVIWSLWSRPRETWTLIFYFIFRKGSCIGGKENVDVCNIEYVKLGHFDRDKSIEFIPLKGCVPCH